MPTQAQLDKMLADYIAKFGEPDPTKPPPKGDLGQSMLYSTLQKAGAFDRYRNNKELKSATDDFTSAEQKGGEGALSDAKRAGTWSDSAAFRESLAAESSARTKALRKIGLERLNAIRKKQGLPPVTEDGGSAQRPAPEFQYETPGIRPVSGTGEVDLGPSAPEPEKPSPSITIPALPGVENKNSKTGQKLQPSIPTLPR